MSRCDECGRDCLGKYCVKHHPEQEKLLVEVEDAEKKD